MRTLSARPRASRTLLAAAGLLALTAAPALGQHRPAAHWQPGHPCPPVPCLPAAPAPAPAPGGLIMPPPDAGAVPAPPPAGAETAMPAPAVMDAPAPVADTAVGGDTYTFLGDLLGPSQIRKFSVLTSNTSSPVQRRKVIIPSASYSFKVAENESPRPQNRFFFTFNYFNNVNDAVNSRLTGGSVGQINVYREVIGFERTFLDGNASFGLRLPINTLTAQDGATPGAGGTFTDVGDLTFVLKYALVNERDRVFSGGLVVTVPTGPDTFADVPADVEVMHNTLLQPFIGYIFAGDSFYFHGFTSLIVPTDIDDVTILFNDFGIGYFMYRNRNSDRLVTAVTPTAEVHINTPLNHRGAFDFSDPSPTADVVNLTGGVIFELNGRSTLTFGAAVPVTGPRPFDIEGIAQFNLRY